MLLGKLNSLLFQILVLDKLLFNGECIYKHKLEGSDLH